MFLRVNLVDEPDTLDPQRATSVVSVTVLRNLYASLLRVGEDQSLSPWMATDVPTIENGGISPDGLTYTFRLRAGLKWSDGQPLIAQHFVDGAKRLFEYQRENHYADLYRVLASEDRSSNEDGNMTVSTEAGGEQSGDGLSSRAQRIAERLGAFAPNDRTIVYQLSRRSPSFLLLSSMWPLYPVRRDKISAYGAGWTEPGSHVSNGFFRLKEWAHGRRVVLERNPYYHAARDVGLQGIGMAMIDDSEKAFHAYLNNDLDITTLGPAELDYCRRDSSLADELRSHAALTTIGVYFNVAHGPLSSLATRLALSCALDREEYAETVRSGAVAPAYSWIPPGVPGHDESAGPQGWPPLSRAQELMREAGYGDDRKLELNLLQPQRNVAEVSGDWVKRQWEEKLPVSVTTHTLDAPAYFEAQNSGQFDATMGGWGADYPDPENWMTIWRTGSSLNVTSFSDLHVDGLLDAASHELDPYRRNALYGEAQRAMLKQVPFAPLYHGRLNLLVKPWVHNLTTSPMEAHIPGDMFFDRVLISRAQHPP